MLDRSNVFEVSREGHRLLRLEAKAVGRKFRRFLERLVANGLVTQTFAYDEGFNERQLKTLAVYAKHISTEQQADLPAGVATYKGVLFDECFGLVANHYQLEFDVDTASVAQLRKAVELVVILADWMHAFVGNANLTALLDCPEYVYRNLPCSIVPDEKLWCVSGDDIRGGAGVLEWCYDEADAREILAAMQRFPERFTRLKAERWAAVMSIPEEQVAAMA